MCLCLHIFANDFASTGIERYLTRCINKLTITNCLAIRADRCGCVGCSNLFLFHYTFSNIKQAHTCLIKQRFQENLGYRERKGDVFLISAFTNPCLAYMWVKRDCVFSDRTSYQFILWRVLSPSR